MDEDIVYCEKALIAGDLRRASDLLTVADDLKEDGIQVAVVPCGVEERKAIEPSLSALMFGGYDALVLHTGWSRSPISIVLRDVATILGIQCIYTEGADAEMTPNETEAEVRGYSEGMTAAHRFLKEASGDE